LRQQTDVACVVKNDHLGHRHRWRHGDRCTVVAELRPGEMTNIVRIGLLQHSEQVGVFLKNEGDEQAIQEASAKPDSTLRLAAATLQGSSCGRRSVSVLLRPLGDGTCVIAYIIKLLKP